MLSENSPSIRKTDPDMHEQRVADLVAALKAGSHPSTAAAYAGISSRTLSDWVKAGNSLRAIQQIVDNDDEDDREPSPGELELMWLASRVEQAQATAEHNLVAVVEKAASEHDDWRAAMALLERRFRDRWARRTEVTGADGGALEIESAADKRERVDQALASMAAKVEQVRERKAEIEEEDDIVDAEVIETD